MSPPPDAVGPWCITARGLSAGYGETTVLDGISFEMASGRITVVLGPGGGGKSTLLRALGAEPERPERPWTRGDLTVCEASPGFLPQKIRGEERTLAELLAAGAAPGISPRRLLGELWRCAPKAEAVLAPLLERPLGALPGPEARLAQLTATVPRGRLLLLDEPDAGLPPDYQEWIVRRVGDLRGTRTVVLATHNLKVARALADFVLLLIDGSIIEAGESSDFFGQPQHPRTRHFIRMGN